MTESDAPEQDNPRPVHHETLAEAAAEGPLAGLAAEDAAQERGEYGSSGFVDPETAAEDREEGSIVGGLNWPGE
jgi:hypothetical protein